MTKAPDIQGQSEFDANGTYKELVCSEKWKELRSPEYHAYRRQWDEVPRSKTELDFPIHLDIETTTVCNLKCPMCPRTEMVAKQTFGEVGNMSREDFASIIDQGVAGGVKSIKLNYLGEPLVHEDVVWQVGYAKSKGVLDVMMNSNATALTKERAKALLEAGLDDLFVSFDAVSPDLFEQQRVGTTIGKVADNVYNFIKLRNESYPHVQVRLSMVMYDDPVWGEQFEAMKVMWKRLVDAIGYGNYTERDPDLRAEYPEKKGFWCAQPFQRMFLKYNGNVTVCCIDDKDEMVVGDWRKTPLQAIWQSEEYRRIRRLHASGQYYDLALCRKCCMPYQS
jgi:radical SAM protein with 4Fe4S-binding SPASM domain